jgi:hypothetical protein
MKEYTKRYFYRCANKDCAKTWAVDITIAAHNDPDIAINRKAYGLRYETCPHCGHTPTRQNYIRGHKLMGFVRTPRAYEQEQRERLVEEGVTSACDGRCTNAKGPDCECVCGGKNHGTQRLVVVQHDAGPVPQEG